MTQKFPTIGTRTAVILVIYLLSEKFELSNTSKFIVRVNSLGD